MKTIIIDFSTISTLEDFYIQFSEKATDLFSENYFTEVFGNNLDALYDALTGEMKLLTEIHFINIDLFQLDDFENLIDTFTDAENELDGKLNFKYFIQH